MEQKLIDGWLDLSKFDSKPSTKDNSSTMEVTSVYVNKEKMWVERETEYPKKQN